MDHELLTLRRSMDRLFQDTMNRMERPANGNRYPQEALVPRADAWETAEELLIELALPGVNADQVDLTFEKDTLTIRGQFQRPEREGSRLLRELPTGEFLRRFSLQVPVDVDQIEATYENGLLRLRLPKSEQVKPRKIEVRTA